MEKKPAVYLPAPFLSFSSSAIKRGSMNRRRWFGVASTVDWLTKNPSKITSDTAAQSRHIIEIIWLILWLVYDLSSVEKQNSFFFTFVFFLKKAQWFRQLKLIHTRSVGGVFVTRARVPHVYPFSFSLVGVSDLFLCCVSFDRLQTVISISSFRYCAQCKQMSNKQTPIVWLILSWHLIEIKSFLRNFIEFFHILFGSM